ncbi:DUF736 domain-containing protein [Sphingomonas oligoaromativorans]|uniref:DUF736 domain-containing protein n=1 Tax=Sphingomonas oligoaromativorans TaxID=575322 RepID=UPI0014228A6A|nr:DUF736 domain-containing protein [Sphingomonas oligoaromativorans]NIJ34081.1 uncharacterized protein (DUF736 family) [Sphingomonas oligoaromativorans]
MAMIGTFRKAGSGFEGSITTLSVQRANVRLVKNEEDRSDKAPDYRIFAGEAEIGAAWEKVAQNERPYLSCKLDDPSFTAPIYPSLFEETDGGFTLKWTRSGR